jgi:HEAT repeat protein
MGQVWGLDDQGAIAELASTLGDRDPDVRVHAAEGLAWFGGRAVAATPALIAATRDREARVRSQALFSLLDCQVTPPNTVAREQAVRAAVRALADGDAMVRMVAAQGLAEVGQGEEALPILVRGLKENDPNTHSRRRALWSLGRMGAEAAGAIPALREIILDPVDAPDTRYLRVQAALILDRLGAEAGH